MIRDTPIARPSPWLNRVRFLREHLGPETLIQIACYSSILGLTATGWTVALAA